ncbi:hypothetical protein [Mycobacterium vicinigordonae]|uniref:Uncharacterized protein n=1 Tax=Mycobacterium vicinigordonae TaxID=1719132 RepID=A0A7D6I7P2_9MYCO|nr:hypothetical protein [Mycobacterium vicinigordonae]QLL08998.1 hypothetical protein H0P51_08955 [Mycobacterium vicinigordonae]
MGPWLTSASRLDSRDATLNVMARQHGSIEFENNPQISRMKDEDAALAEIARRHPECIDVVLTGVGGQMGGTQRRAEFTYGTAGEQ